MKYKTLILDFDGTYGNNTKEQLKKQNPDYIIDDFSKLLEII